MQQLGIERGWDQKTLTSRRALRIAFLKDSAQLFGVGMHSAVRRQSMQPGLAFLHPRDPTVLPWGPPEEPTPELVNGTLTCGLGLGMSRDRQTTRSLKPPGPATDARSAAPPGIARACTVGRLFSFSYGGCLALTRGTCQFNTT